MTSLEFSVPSKTFLLGEYVVLNEGPAILLTTNQRFNLIASHNKQLAPSIDGINLESPTGKLIKNNIDYFHNYDIQFIDPYHKLGGFGASSAQFVMLSALKCYIQKNKINDIDLLNNYLQYASHSKGIPPSGVDLIAQLHGNICFFHKSKNTLLTFTWPFTDIAYCLIHTGNKLATHHHLEQLKKFNTSVLEEIVFNGLRSLQEVNSQLFIDSIKNYADELQAQGLVANKTRKLLKQLDTHTNILAAKGCGALGSDVILVIFSKINQDEIITWLKGNKLHVITYGQDVANGLEIREINNSKLNPIKLVLI